MTDWKHGFYTDGYEAFSRADDAEEAQGAADDIIDIYREGAEGDEWNEDVGYVHYGICLPLGVATQEPIDDELFEDAVDYQLREPAIDAAAFWEVVSKHAPKLAEALAGAAPLATDPIIKLELWKRESPEDDRSYHVDSYGRFYVSLLHSDTRVASSDADTLPEAVDAALEAAKRGAT